MTKTERIRDIRHDAIRRMAVRQGERLSERARTFDNGKADADNAKNIQRQKESEAGWDRLSTVRSVAAATVAQLSQCTHMPCPHCGHMHPRM